MRTKLRGKVTLLFMMLGLLLAVPTVALAADLLTEAELSSDVNARTEVAPNGTTNFDIKVWARGNLPNNTNVTGNAVITKAYTMGAGGAITANTGSGSTTTVTFAKNHNYGADGQTCPATVPTQPAGVTGKGCATDPFVVPATITVGNLADGTNGTLTVSAVGSNSLGTTSPATCSNSDNAIIDPNTTPDATDCTSDQGFVTVASPNTAPVANNDNYNVNEDGTLNVPDPGVLGNDTDADNNMLTVGSPRPVSGPTNGSLQLHPTGSFDYTPVANFHSIDTFTYLANDGTADSNVATVTITVASVNDPPTVKTPAPDDTGKNEGATLSTQGAFEDVADNDPLTITKTGAGTVVDNGDGTWSWSLQTNDNISGSVTVTADDNGPGGTVTDSFDYSTVNVAPTATKDFPSSSVNEGSSFNLALTDPSDPSSVDTTAGFKYAFDCGSGYGTFGTFSSTSCSTNDNGNRNVGAKIQDKDGGVTEYIGTVTVNNVAPTITGITASVQNAISGHNVTFTGTATDPSSVDTTAGFYWQWAVDGGALGTFGTQGNNQFTHSFSDCGSHSVSAKAKDKDNGLSDLFTKSNVVNVYSAHYLAPLNEGMYNSVQAGRVVPVKISVGCSGNLTGLQPSIQLLKGEQDGGESTSGLDNVETLSVSSADTTGIMRAIDGGYIYNLQVPSTAKANDLFTIRVNPFGGSNASSNMYIVLKIRK